MVATDMNGVELPTRPLPKPPPRAISDLLASMEDMESVDIPALISIFGDIGTGKTVSAMEFMQAIVPQDKKIVYVDSALNFATLKNKEHKHLMRRTKKMAYENQEQLVLLANAIRSSPDLKSKIGGIVLDEYSTMSNLDQHWVITARAEQANKEGKYKDPFTAALPDYGAQKIRSAEVVNAFLMAGVHVVFVCHERYDDLKRIVPDFPDKTSKEFSRLIHGVYHATVEVAGGQRKYKLQLQPVNRVSCKNRIGGLGDFATIQEVAEAYNTWGIDEESKPTTIEEPPVAVNADDFEQLLK